MDIDKNLQYTLETNIVNLFNKVKNDSWLILIFQTLLWSFRRWSIHYLMLNETIESMKDYAWDSHLDLVREFAPVELRDFAVIWLNPINITNRTDILNELNEYLILLVDALDRSINTDNENNLNTIADFLDTGLTKLIDAWLLDKNKFRIYPSLDQTPDSFSVTRIHEIMRVIMDETSIDTNKNYTQFNEQVVVPVPVAVPEPVAVPVAIPEPVAVPEPIPEPVPVPIPQPVAQETVKAAINIRRATRKNRNQNTSKTRKRSIKL